MFCARLFICAFWSPAGKGLTSWLSFVVSSVSLSLSHWYPGSGVVLDCIDSWSLHHYLLLFVGPLLILIACQGILSQTKRRAIFWIPTVCHSRPQKERERCRIFQNFLPIKYLSQELDDSFYMHILHHMPLCRYLQNNLMVQYFFQFWLTFHQLEIEVRNILQPSLYLYIYLFVSW